MTSNPVGLLLGQFGTSSSVWWLRWSLDSDLGARIFDDDCDYLVRFGWVIFIVWLEKVLQRRFSDEKLQKEKVYWITKRSESSPYGSFHRAYMDSLSLSSLFRSPFLDLAAYISHWQEREIERVKLNQNTRSPVFWGFRRSLCRSSNGRASNEINTRRRLRLLVSSSANAF